MEVTGNENFSGETAEGETMNIIKCHMCKLDISTCNYKCMEVEDVSSLYKEGMTEENAIPERFCTNHSCKHNPTGFRCVLDKCVVLERN